MRVDVVSVFAEEIIFSCDSVEKALEKCEKLGLEVVTDMEDDDRITLYAE